MITKISSDKIAEITNLITKENPVIKLVLEQAGSGQEAKASIPALLFTEAAKKSADAVIAVQNGEAVYRLPVSQVHAASLAKQLGANEKDIEILISVNQIPEASAPGVSKNKLDLVSGIFDFTVEAAAGGKTVAAGPFSVYVERDITGAKTFDASKAVGVVLKENGGFAAVPTLFEGSMATVKSLTNSNYAIVENEVTFPDVDKKNWAEEYIETLASKYIIQGKETGKYAPGEQMTRAQFTLLLVRALGLPSVQYDDRFKDVKGNEWFNTNGELMAAVEYGIIQGKEDGRFAPNEKITRSQAAVMIKRAMDIGFVGYDSSQMDGKKQVEDFKDSKKVGSWAKDSIEAVYQAGIVSGKEDGTFDPNGFTKRDQMAKILANFLISANLMNDTIND
ncbi:S-layer homology domain-containing protein [Bacillus infantis]|nr:S-layer homology domain-containing protein [Bacillus infantis]